MYKVLFVNGWCGEYTDVYEAFWGQAGVVNLMTCKKSLPDLNVCEREDAGRSAWMHHAGRQVKSL